MRCAGLGTAPAGCMVSCAATVSPVASVPLKTLRPTAPLGAVFARHLVKGEDTRGRERVGAGRLRGSNGSKGKGNWQEGSGVHSLPYWREDC